jgi:hypothetical protein
MRQLCGISSLSMPKAHRLHASETVYRLIDVSDSNFFPLIFNTLSASKLEHGGFVMKFTQVRCLL